jgi:hypothetical protein
MGCIKMRKMRKLFVCVMITCVGCNQVEEKAEEKDFQVGASSNDSLEKVVRLNDTLINNADVALSSESHSIAAKLIGVWRIKKYEPLADVFGYTETDFKKQKGSVALVITKDSIKFSSSLSNACRYDSISVQEYDFLGFIEHLEYNGYNKEMLKKITRIKAISFTGCLNEIYLIADKFYYEFDGVLIEIEKVQ